MNRFATWKEARDAAQAMSDFSNLDVGIWHAVEFGQAGFNVRYLPRPENRYGHELACEVVQPMDWAKHQARGY